MFLTEAGLTSFFVSRTRADRALVEGVQGNFAILELLAGPVVVVTMAEEDTIVCVRVPGPDVLIVLMESDWIDFETIGYPCRGQTP